MQKGNAILALMQDNEAKDLDRLASSQFLP
jgi:hypothetical protein